MSEIHIYIIIAVFTVIALNSNFFFGKDFQNGVNENNILLVEHLTQFSTKKKNYRNKPENYSSSGYGINGRKSGNSAFFSYKFPLIDSYESTFSTELNAYNVSSTVSMFGVKRECFGPIDNEHYGFYSKDVNFLKSNMNKEGFYFESFEEGKYGLDYNYVISISTDISGKIALFLHEQLQRNGKDSYENRVRAALNFVQFIPYGVPDFDHEEDCYFGLALPHESIAISYSDCDSKSALFASILCHLINPKNVILVGCLIEEGGHMIAGVAGFNFPGQYYKHNGKDFLLIETTIPIPLESQPSNRFKEIEIIPVIQK